MSPMQTRATLLLRLKSDGPSREVAWQEFLTLYAPIISRFARARGVPPDAIDELTQDIVAGFFAAQPRFTYDPAKGRFRAYLMACVSNAVRTRRPRSEPGRHDRRNRLGRGVEERGSRYRHRPSATTLRRQPDVPGV
jgi:DNA-directed RNA polymerase specialized sigma24 family protein